MPGTNYEYERAFILGLPIKHRDKASELLWNKDLSELVYIQRNLENPDVKEEYGITSVPEWRLIIKAVITSRISYFDTSICTPDEIAILLTILNKLVHIDVFDYKNISMNFKNNYPVLTAWIYDSHLHLRKKAA